MEKKIRGVLAGCGSMSKRWLSVLTSRQDVEIVGLVDIIESHALGHARDFSLQDAWTGSDFVRALSETAPDVVFDCTVPESHVDITLEALSHGCHVLGEKPLADTMENARKMVTAARESNRIYAVIQNRRYDANIRRLRRFLSSGKIGTITTVNSDFYIGAHFGGFRDHMEHPLLLDMAIHTFDAARFICGADPEMVYCHEWNPVGSWYDHDVSAVAVYEMNDGMVYTYRGSWCAEGMNTSWEGRWRIVGDHGSVTWEGNDQFGCQIVKESGGFLSTMKEAEIPAYDPKDRVGGHEGIIDEFLQAVREGGSPETVCSDNIKSLAMVFGAIESSRGKKPVPVSW